MQDLKARKIRRLEAQLVELAEQAAEAYWQKGNLATQAIEREIQQVEHALQEMS